MGVKMAAPERDIFIIVGDGSYLMLSSELATAVQERIKLNVILLDNHGFKSIGSLSRSLGQDGFGTRFIYRKDGVLSGDSVKDVETLHIDYAENAHSLGAHVIRAKSYSDFVAAVKEAPKIENTVVIVVECDRLQGVPGYESWWDVPVAEVSNMPSVQESRQNWETMRRKEQYYF
jgi:3D-(3,5/4)-trihydroxycyclohexane-1,2-dione acylhydrolase (decyclizing)